MKIGDREYASPREFGDACRRGYEESRRLWRTWLRRGSVWGIFLLIGLSLGNGYWVQATLLIALASAVIGWYYG